MKKSYKDHNPSISLTVLATLCFVTLVMSQTRFKITKEMSHELYPPVLRSKDCWFLYTIGNPDSFKCVLRAFIVISSPVLSLISTVLLLFGKVESNPYFFIPWLFLTLKGLLLVQTDNLITILKDMSTRTNYAFGFRMEDLKWLLFYFTIFLIDLVEAFSFCEIFDLFLVLWNHHPGFNVESSNLDAVRKEITEIIETLSKCSLGSLSKISLRSFTDSDSDCEVKNLGSIMKLPLKNHEKISSKLKPVPSKTLSKGDLPIRGDFNQNLSKNDARNNFQNQVININLSEGDVRTNDVKGVTKSNSKGTLVVEMLSSKKDITNFGKSEVNEQCMAIKDTISITSYNSDLHRDLVNKQVYSQDVFCS